MAFRTWLGALAALAFSVALPPDPARAADCAGLAKLAPAGVRIVSATPMPARSHFAPTPRSRPVDVAFCRVQGVIETEIGFELWLPDAVAWNHRLLSAGVGGQAGSLNYVEMARGLARGYAAASTDTGHKADDKHWLLGDPMRAANYAERGNHLLAENAKALIAAYYAAPLQHAFFVGCSGGGRQALTEVQRFPGDYDGVIAGAPGPRTPEMSARRMWEMIQHTRSKGVLSEADWKHVAEAGIAACDDLDGVHDGVVENPARCRFDVASLGCGKVAAKGCFSPEQVAVARRIYAPLVDENGKRIDGGLLPGIPVSPTPAPEPFTPGPAYLAVVLFGDGVHHDANWDAKTFRISTDLPAVDKVMNLHADNPDLSGFKARGGKLIMYQGWTDPLVSPQETAAYYEAIERKMGPASARQFVRLFMAPGVDHCVGGAGPDQFGGVGGDAPVADADHDLLTALERWVQEGRAPERVIASKLAAGKVVRTRPLCAYPVVARYSGKGSIDEAASFNCGSPPPRLTGGPKLSGPIPFTPTSQIFGPAALPGTPEAAALAKAGYVQEEYFLSGAANVYGYDAAGKTVVERSGLPYTTRLLVVRPKDPKRFSGNVQLNMFHPSMAHHQWSRISAYVVRHGDAFVAVGIGADPRQRETPASQPPTAAHLIPKWYEPARYAPMQWPDEDGIRWDVFGDTAKLLKQGGALGGLKVSRVYASGWSFLGSFLRNFINDGFHDRFRMADGRPAIDGYLIGIASGTQSSGYLPINSHSETLPLGHPKRVVQPADVPVIELMSENEAAGGGPTARDGDGIKGGHRLYQIGGVTHTDLGVPSPVEPATAQLRTKGHPAAAPAPACGYENSDVPMRDVAQAALANLDRWSRGGPPAPPSAVIELGPNGPVADAVGNTRGGVRLAQLEVPLARYGAPPNGACAGQSPYKLERRVPLSAAELAKLYPGGREEQVRRFKAALDRLVRERYLLAPDAEAELAQDRVAATKAFGP